MIGTDNNLIFFTIAECASILHVHRSTISRLLKTGQIKHIAVGGRKLIRKSDLLEFLDNQIVNNPQGIRTDPKLMVVGGQ